MWHWGDRLYFIFICYARLTWILLLWQVLFNSRFKLKKFFLPTITRVPGKGFDYTPHDLQCWNLKKKLTAEGHLIEAIFHSINLVSPNSLLNEVSPRDFRVQTNELIHHEATGVHDGNSWPNTYSCWDCSSPFSLFMTKPWSSLWRHRGLHEYFPVFNFSREMLGSNFSQNLLTCTMTFDTTFITTVL